MEEYRRRHGSLRAAQRVGSVALKRAGVLSCSAFVVLWPERVNVAAYDSRCGYQRVLLPASEMRELARQLPHELPPPFLASAHETGDQCFAILDGPVLASFGWYATRTAGLFGHSLEFDRDYVYMYHGFTLPAYRGQRLHALGLASALTHFHGMGRKALISTVNVTNYASLSSVARLGFTRCGSIVQLGSGRLALRFTSPATRRFGLRFAAESG